MKPESINKLAVKARCPDCGGAISVFDFKDSSREFGHVLKEEEHTYDGKRFTRIHYRLLRCSGCERAGLAKFHDGNLPPVLESFYPRAIASAPLPNAVPEGIVKEYREAELCASVEAWRAQAPFSDPL